MPNYSSETAQQQQQNQTGTTSQTGETTGTSTTAALSPSSTVQQNLAAIPGLSNLTSLINAINQQSQSAANMGRIPQEQALETASSQNIADALAGRVSGGTQGLLARQAAESGINTGSASPAAYLSLLGKTSEELQNMGQQWLSSATARNPAAATYDPTQGLLTAQGAGSTTTSSGTTSNTGTSETSGTSSGSSSTSGYNEGGNQPVAQGQQHGSGYGGTFNLADLLSGGSGLSVSGTGSGVGFPGLTGTGGTDAFGGSGLTDQNYIDMQESLNALLGPDTGYDYGAGDLGVDEG